MAVSESESESVTESDTATATATVTATVTVTVTVTATATVTATLLACLTLLACTSPGTHPAPPAPKHAGPERPLRAANAELAALIGATSASQAAPEGFDLHGTGVRVGVWDDGVARASHTDLRGRVLIRDLGGYGEHATHTSATIAGSGAGNAAARGVAPEARLWAHDWLLDLAEVEAEAPGLSVSSHAYGLTLGWSVEAACPDRPMWWGGAGERSDAAFGRYGLDAAGIDAVVWRSDLPMVWPAGNERSDLGVAAGDAHYHAGSCSDLFRDAHVQEHTLQFGLIGGAGLAKNALTVGAVRNVEQAAIDAARIVPLDMSSFGPSGDGRIKPELVAGGEAVRSASARDDEAYGTLSGTSSATAATAGVIALLVEEYRKTHGGADPGAAELRALLVHTAREAAARGPDYATGYGLLDAQAASALIAQDAQQPSGERMLRAGALLPDAELELKTAEVAAGDALRVTLAWSDPPGAPQTGATLDASVLLNDLDLEIEAPDGAHLFHAWTLDPAHPERAAQQSAANRRDNLEVVDVAAGAHGAGRFIVRVRAHGGLWRDAAQPFVLVSSVGLAAPDQPLLALPRYVGAEVDPDATAPVLHVMLDNQGTGSLAFKARSLTPWLAVSADRDRAPARLTLEIDAAALPGPGEWLGRVAIDSDDPRGPRTLGVVARVACKPACGDRECGTDPICGEPCGRCAEGEVCQDGACGQARSACPEVELGSALGHELLAGDFGDLRGTHAASCGGDGSKDVTAAWSAPADGLYAFTTRGSLADSVLYARSDCDGDELACNDDSGGQSAALALTLKAGERVTLTVDGFERQSGAFTLNAARVTCPSVDLGSRLGQGLVRASTFGGLDSMHGQCGGEGGEDITLAWTAPVAGKYRFALFVPSFAAVLHVHDGDCDGPELGCSAAADVGPLVLDLDAGQRVVVAVDGNAGKSGTFQLDIDDAAASCAGRCGERAGAGGCACDDACAAAGDCCSDACSACGACRCAPRCQGRACGSDGCGGHCGECAPGEICADGRCTSDACAGVTCDACSVCEQGKCKPLADGAACEDADPCSVRDRCEGGACRGVALDCDDGFDCTIDRCDARSGECTYVLDPACGDAGACDPAKEVCGLGRNDAGQGESAADGGPVKLAHPRTNGGGCDCALAPGAPAPRAAGVIAGTSLLGLSCRRRRRARARSDSGSR